MRSRYSLLAGALVLSQLAQAKPATLTFEHIRAIADTTTPASDSPQFVALDAAIQQSLIAALKGDAATLTRDQLDDTKQSKKLADKKSAEREWLRLPEESQSAGGYPAVNGVSGIAEKHHCRQPENRGER